MLRRVILRAASASSTSTTSVKHMSSTARVMGRRVMQSQPKKCTKKNVSEQNQLSLAIRLYDVQVKMYQGATEEVRIREDRFGESKFGDLMGRKLSEAKVQKNKYSGLCQDSEERIAELAKKVFSTPKPR
jgi:hypothetical protein